MRIDQLSYILAINTAGSISKASRQLHISHQSLLKTLTNIEKELNVTIFHRDSHGVHLTPEGQLVKNYAEDILLRTEQLNAELLSYQEQLIPTQNLTPLHCDVTLNINPLVVTKLLPSFSEYPSNFNTNLSINKKENNQIISDFLNQACPFGIISYSIDEKPNFTDLHLIERFLFEDSIYATFSSTHPLAKYKTLSLKTLLKYPLAIYYVNEKNNSGLVHFLQKNFPAFNPYIMTNNFEIIKHYIEKGIAVGISVENVINCLPFYNGNPLVKCIRLKDSIPQIVSAFIDSQYYSEHRTQIDSFLNSIIELH